MPPSPTPVIVPDRPLDRRYLSRDDIEELTPSGRTLHQLEGVAFSISSLAVRYRTDRERRLSHDAHADAAVLAIDPLAVRLLAWPDAEVQRIGAEIRALVRTYLHHDRHEDAAAVSGDGRVSLMHGWAKRLAGWIEKACDGIRQQHRGVAR